MGRGKVYKAGAAWLWSRPLRLSSLCLFLVVCGAAKEKPCWGQSKESPSATEVTARGDQDAQRPLVVTMEWNEMPGGEEYLRGLMPRELARQAVLIAVREELNLLTRDVLWGEAAPPESLARNVTLRLQLKPIPDQFEVVVLAEGAQKPVWEKTIALPTDALAAFVELVEVLERGSREELPDALRAHLRARWGDAAGEMKRSVSTANRENRSADQEIKVDRWLAEPDIFTHFLAIRELHDARLRDGESRDSLARLSRAYANLSMLVRHQFNAVNVTAGARSLLYAQRHRQLGGDDGLVGWQASYPAALLGWHWDVIQRLPELKKSPASEFIAQDPWIEFVEPLAKCDYPRLQELAQQDSRPTVKLARLWGFWGAAYGQSDSHFAEALTETDRHCPAVGGVYWMGYFHGRFGEKRWAAANMLSSIPSHIIAWSDGDIDLPASVMQLRRLRAVVSPKFRVGESEGLASFAEAARRGNELRSAGPTDLVEFSWAIPAYLIREELFLTAFLEMLDSNNAMTRDLSPLANTFAEALEGHPWTGTLRVMGMEGSFQNPAVARQVKTIRLNDLQISMAPLMRQLWEAPSDHHQAIGKEAWANLRPETNAWSLLEMIQNNNDISGRAQAADMLVKVSPENRHGLRQKLLTIVDPHEEDIAYWTAKVAPDDAEGLVGVARLFEAMERMDLAKEYYQKSLDINPDPHVYLRRSNMFWYLQRYAEWEADLRSAILRLDDGMESANAHKHLAFGLMETGRPKESVEPALIAAGTGSAWGLGTAAVSLEVNGRWEESQQMISNLSQGYGGLSRTGWYYWCHRTGDHRQLNQAKRLAAEFTRSPDGKNPHWGDFSGTMALLEGRLDKALTFFQAAHRADRRKDGWPSMMAAWLAQEQGDTKLRDEILTQFKPRMEQWRREYQFEYEEPLDTFTFALSDCLRGTATAETIEILEFYYQGLYCERRQEYGFLMGKVFEKAGDQKKAENYWREALKGPYNASSGATLAGAELVKIYGPQSSWDKLPSGQVVGPE